MFNQLSKWLTTTVITGITGNWDDHSLVATFIVNLLTWLVHGNLTFARLLVCSFARLLFDLW